MQANAFTLDGFYDTILIRYAGEIGIKSYRVRRRLLERLASNIENQLERKHVQGCKVIATHARFFIEFTDATDVFAMHEFLQQIPGILSFSYCITFGLDIEELCNHVSGLGDHLLRQGSTFAARVTREGTHPFSSHDIAVRVGDHVASHFEHLGLKVNLDEPDTTFFIEIRDDVVSLYHEKFPGLGGMPRDVSSPVFGCVGLQERSWDTCSQVFKRGANLHVILLREILPSEEKVFQGKNAGVVNFLNQDVDLVDHIFRLLDYQESNIAPVHFVPLTKNLWSFIASIPLPRHSDVFTAYLQLLVPNLINVSIREKNIRDSRQATEYIAAVSDYNAAGHVAPAGLRWLRAINDAVDAMLPRGQAGLPILFPRVGEGLSRGGNSGVITGDFVPACETGTFLEFIKDKPSRDQLLAIIAPLVEQRSLVFFDLIEHGFVSRER
ncbi:MAG TPA: THUMP domain-containing protein [Candidatus Lokiarchaeia archaeon]|nr:THUMP domain-containing protein [Candidatus Lokiarchaeia archaeon]